MSLKPVFYINVKVYNDDNFFYTDKANWLRLKLYLEPFENVILICEETFEKGNDWIKIPSSVECRAYTKSSLWMSKRFSIFIDFFRLFFFSFISSKKAPFIGILISGPPFFHIGLLLSVILNKKILSIFIGSISESYLYSNGSDGNRNYILKLKEKISYFLESIVISKSNVILSAGNTIDKYKLHDRLHIKFSTSTLMSNQVGLKNRKRFSNPNKISWIYTGVLNKEKGVDILLESLRKIREDDNRHYLTLIGREDQNFNIREYISENNLDKFVTLTGHIDHESVIQFLNEADVFVFLSLHEGMPKAPLEAMAIGIPVIVTPTGAEYYVKNGVNGIIVNCNNVEAVVSSISKISRDYEFRENIIINAKRTAIMQSYDFQIQKVHDFLVKLNPDLTSEYKNDWIN